jgi:hypothetical protein
LLPARVGETLRVRLEGLSKVVRDIAWKAQVRLCARYRRLAAAGKKMPVTIAAIAREIAAFLWAIGRKVEPLSWAVPSAQSWGWGHGGEPPGLATWPGSARRPTSRHRKSPETEYGRRLPIRG